MRITTILFCCCLLFALPANAEWARGIYLTQSTLENTAKVEYLIKQSKATGINTFIIDLKHNSKRYNQNIKLVKANHIQYVARIVMFPDGGTSDLIRSPEYWQHKYQLVKHAIAIGADQIQLDYIRYKSSRAASSQNAQDIYEVIKWFKQKVAAQNIPLQIDVFGEALHFPSRNIGQNIGLFGNSIDVLCPMTYPSHYEPYQYHATRPYQTVHHSLVAMQKQLRNNVPFKVIPYIELYNYRYPLTKEQKISYIHDQIMAIQDSPYTDGWYAWNPNNYYDNLFAALRRYNLK